jgi:protein tyrosine phosphatase (PTP) superfamily phosphohydrolase (DUF442 family)
MQVAVAAALCVLAGMPLPTPLVHAQEGSQDFGLAGARRPEEGLLFGGQPTAEQLASVGAAGYRVVDLRAATEDRGYDEPAEAARRGISYTAIPVDGEALRRDETYEAFFAALEGERPILAHCASGNRVGGLYYAYLVSRRGMARDQALELAKASGLRSEALVAAVDQWLDRRATPQ